LQLELVRRFGNSRGQLPDDLPLFPDEQGNWCERDGFVRTIIQMAIDQSVDLQDEMGRFIAGEHVWRVSGARMLARASIALPQIKLMARWGSDVIMRYVADAPLANIARDFRVGCNNDTSATTLAAAAPSTWESAIKDNATVIMPTRTHARKSPALQDDEDQPPTLERFAINPSTAFAHVIARRKSWERPVQGRTTCGQDFRGRGYEIVTTLTDLYLLRNGTAVPTQRCTKCAKPDIWDALVSSVPESDTESD
jgi:hypothetical protein